MVDAHGFRNLRACSSQTMLQPRIQSLTRWSVIARRAYSTGTTTVQPIKRAPSNLDIRDEDWTFVSGATGKALPSVPPLIEWPKRYPMKKGVGSADRSYLFNPAAAREVVKTYGLEENGHPKIVLETYPGMVSAYSTTLSPGSNKENCIYLFLLRSWRAFKGIAGTSTDDAQEIDHLRIWQEFSPGSRGRTGYQS